MLASRRETVLEYKDGDGDLAVPTGVPLPRLLARAATLCSGYVSRTEVRAGKRGDVPTRYRVYRSVPPDVFHECAGKTGQLPDGEG